MSDINEFVTADDIYDDNARDIETHRGELIAALNEAMAALNRATQAANALISNAGLRRRTHRRASRRRSRRVPRRQRPLRTGRLQHRPPHRRALLKPAPLKGHPP